MQPTQLHAMLAAQPFRPFRIVMSSGQSYEVRHPEMAMLTRTILFVGQGSDIGPTELPEYAVPCAVCGILSADCM